MGLETQPIPEAVTLQSLKLPNPIHDARTYRSPIVLVVRLAHHILAVAMPNAVFGKQFIPGWIRRASQRSCVPWIPVQHEVLVRNRLQQCSRLFPRRCVAGHFVFEEKDDVVFSAAFSSLLQLGIDCRAVRLGIIQTPVVEAANPVRAEGLAERDTVLEQPVLCAGIEVRMKLITFFTLR